MPRIWFLILRHQVWLLDFYLVYFVCNLGTSFVLPPISLERALQVLVREDRKSRWSDSFSVLASSSLHRFDHALHMMSFPYSIFLIKKKKRGRNCRKLSFLGRSDIACVFTWYLNSLCINLLWLDMIESSWLYLANVFLYMQKLDSFFLHAMKMYTIQDSPKGTSFLLWLFVSRNSG
jgi:hypothetical protein